jgi:hypothetical protein
MKKCSISRVIGEMPIKVTLRFHLMPVRMATFKNTNNKMLGRMQGKRNPHIPLMGI